MPSRFYRRIRIAPGVKLNLSKRGASVSVGGRGADFTIGTSGARESVGIPGTGLGYYQQQRWRAGINWAWVIGFLLLLAFCAGPSHAAERWALSPDNHWVMIDPDHGRWERAPTGPEHWEWVYGEDWRRDPAGNWTVVPGAAH